MPLSLLRKFLLSLSQTSSSVTFAPINSSQTRSRMNMQDFSVQVLCLTINIKSPESLLRISPHLNTHTHYIWYCNLHAMVEYTKINRLQKKLA